MPAQPIEHCRRPTVRHRRRPAFESPPVSRLGRQRGV